MVTRTSAVCGWPLIVNLTSPRPLYIPVSPYIRTFSSVTSMALYFTVPSFNSWMVLLLSAASPLGPMPTKSSARYRSRIDVSPFMTALRLCCSSPTRAFSVPPPVFFSCDQVALPNDNVKMRQQIQILFIGTSTLFFWKQTNFSPRVQAMSNFGRLFEPLFGWEGI